MNRRKFLKTSAGLFVAAAPAIILPREADAQLLNLKFGAPIPDPPPPATSIPMSFSDPRFASNTPAARVLITATSGTTTNQTWEEYPTYPDGVSAFEWGSTSGTYNLSLCNFDWREGIRISADNGAHLTVDQCFINTVGFDYPPLPDHADGLQGFSGSGGSRANFTITNTCFRSYSDAEAATVYGGLAIGSAGFFWADNMRGDITLDNVLFWGGGRGIDIYADTGTTNLTFRNVYLASSPNGSPWEGHDYDIRATGGTLNILEWTNVKYATVVGGVIVPGASIPSP